MTINFLVNLIRLIGIRIPLIGCVSYTVPITDEDGGGAMRRTAVQNILVYIIRFGCFNVISEVFTQKAIGKNADFFLRY